MRVYTPANYGLVPTPEKNLGQIVTRDELVGVRELPASFRGLRAALLNLGRRFGKQFECLWVTSRRRRKLGKMIERPVDRWVVFSRDFAFGRNSRHADDILYRECIVCDPHGKPLFPGKFVADYLRGQAGWLGIPPVGDYLTRVPQKGDKEFDEPQDVPPQTDFDRDVANAQARAESGRAYGVVPNPPDQEA